MALNIKNERVSQLAAELAAETGASITDAVGAALESRLRQLRDRKERSGMARRLMEVGRALRHPCPAGMAEAKFR
jgi:hypothetical protein